MAAIAQSSRISLEEAQDYVRAVRNKACELFPGKGETFDLIYAPRFRRLIAEKLRLQ